MIHIGDFMRAMSQDNFKKITKSVDAGKSYDVRLNRLLFSIDRAEEYHNGYHNKLIWDSYPCFIKYCSPVNPINLFEVYDDKFLTNFPCVMVRDGLFTLVNFFYRFPMPKGIKTTMIIHEAFAPFVPKKWLPNVVFYRHHLSNSSKSRKEKQKKFLLMVGLTVQSYFSINHLREKIEEIKKIVERDNLELICFLPLRTDNFFQENTEKNHYCYDILREIYLAFGDKVKFTIWDKIKEMKNLDEGLFVDLNEKMRFCSDNYLSHYLMVRSCLPVDAQVKKREVGKDETFVRLSSNHGIVLSNNYSGEYSYLWQDVAQMKEILAVADKNLLDPGFSAYLTDLARDHIPDFTWYK